MSASLVRPPVQEQVFRAVADFEGVGHVFAAATPRSRGSLREQAAEAVDAIRAAMHAEGAEDAIVHQVVFLSARESIAHCRQLVRELYGADMPATSFVPQPPCDGSLLTIEAMGLRTKGGDVAVRRTDEHVVVAKYAGMEWVYAAGAVPRTSAAGVYEKSACALHQLRRLLPEGGAHLNEIIRAWFFLGGIVDDEGDHQRYHEFNRARTDFYRDLHFLDERIPESVDGRVFPASTGIGTSGKGICMSAWAVSSPRKEVVAVPLENPRQTAAYCYAKAYSPQSPKFSRGMALHTGRDTMLFISGTASITNSETRHVGDVRAQTHETLDNIAALISEENLGRHGLRGSGTTLAGLGVIRAYVKRLEDYPIVRDVCRARLGNVPATFVVADVCRPDLLVEIEGIAVAQAAPNAAHPCRAVRSLPCADEGCGKHGPYCPEGCPEKFVCPNAVLPGPTAVP